MRKIKKIRKLCVSKQTLRNLSETHMQDIAGGTGGSGTSGTVHGGGCCAGCGCVRTQVCEY